MQQDDSSESAYFIAISKAQSFQLAMYSVVLLFLGAGLFEAVVSNGQTALGLSGIVVSALAYIFTVLLHELLHGLCFKQFGGKPSYGAGFVGVLPYFYATAHKQSFTLRQMAVVALAPLVGISIITLVGALLFNPLAPILGGFIFACAAKLVHSARHAANH